MNNQTIKQTIQPSLTSLEMQKPCIKVLIVDDEAIIRTGLNKILSEYPNIQIIGEASSGEEAESITLTQRPNIILMDISMPGQGGIETTKNILATNQDVKVLALSIHSDEHYPSQILNAGAQGYITKGVSATEMIEAIQSVHEGNEYICHAVSQKIRTKHLLGRDRLFDCLTDEEMLISSEIVLGETTSSIANKHQLNELDVESTKQAIFDKLNIRNEVSLIHLAIRNGLLDKDNHYFN